MLMKCLKTATVAIILIFLVLAIVFCMPYFLGHFPDYLGAKPIVLIAMIGTWLIWFTLVSIGRLIFKMYQLVMNDTIFSLTAVTIFTKIKQLLLLISCLSFSYWPFFIAIGEYEDAPGVMFLAIIVFLIPTTFYLMAAILLNLLKKAVRLEQLVSN